MSAGKRNKNKRKEIKRKKEEEDEEEEEAKTQKEAGALFIHVCTPVLLPGSPDHAHSTTGSSLKI